MSEIKKEAETESSVSSTSTDTNTRAINDSFKNILSSVLKTNLGQVLKSRSCEKAVGKPNDGDQPEISDLASKLKAARNDENSTDGKVKKGNTARKTVRESSELISSVRSPTKRKMRKFKGGTYNLSIKPKRSTKRKKTMEKCDKESSEAGSHKSNDDEDTSDESEGTNSDMDKGLASTIDELIATRHHNTAVKSFDRSKKSLSNSWMNIELPARDIVTPVWPNNSNDLAKNTWYNYGNDTTHDPDVPPIGASPLASNGDVGLSSEIILCTCQENVSIPFEPNTQKEQFCQAVDCIDDRLVGCCSVVTNQSSISRPGRKIPFLPMCTAHTKRLSAHHCCPGCGLFCTQGMFMRCRSGVTGTMHLFHERCCTVSKDVALCPHCGSSSDWIHVRTRINSNRPVTFLTKQPSINRQPSARMTINRGNEVVPKQAEKSTNVPSASYKIVETGKEISSDGLPMGPDRVQLEALLVNLSIERPMNLRYTIKSFYNAAKSGDVEKILHMLAMSYNPNHKFEEHENETALHAACANGHLITVHVLQQAGAKLDIMDNKMRTPLIAAVENKQTVIIRYLIRAGVNLESRGEDGMMCFHMAAKMGYLEACRCFIETGKLSVNVLDDGGWSSLVWASEFGHKDVVRFLLDCGADPNIRDNEYNTALHWAAFSGGSEICELLLNRECDLSGVNEHGDTPLHIAARQDNYDTIMLFLTRNADISSQNREGETPIMCCPDENSQSWMALSMSRQLKHFARSSMGRSEHMLHRDITHGKELTPIQCVNGVDDEPFPIDYLYIIENCETAALSIDRCITSLQSCTCEDDCSSNNCVCSSLSLRCWYTKEGSLLPEFNLLDPPMIFECNRACRCWKNCNNRVIQHGMVSRLQLFRTQGKGWGVRTLRDIPQGTFICEYIGELISDSEADQRDDDSYLFDLDNRDGETYCIDARYYGNISRFINHLCEPNLVPVKIFVDHQDLRFPRIAFFSSRDIKAYEELGFDYGEKFWIIKYKTFTCMCHSEMCKYSSHRIQELIEKYQRRQREDVDV